MMALQLNTGASILDFLRGMKKSTKVKVSKIRLGETTYWETSWERLDEATRTPGMLVRLTGTETITEDGAEVMYATFTADLDDTGSMDKLAIRIG